jgi:hypothetical protein
MTSYRRTVAIFLTSNPNYDALPHRLASRFSVRNIFAEISDRDDGVFVAASLHATPGSGRIDSVRVKEWKPFFHGAVAIELSRLSDPFLFAIDANEPRLETLDLVQFHWAN